MLVQKLSQCEEFVAGDSTLLRELSKVSKKTPDLSGDELRTGFTESSHILPSTFEIISTEDRVINLLKTQ
jgi:hypothetical protein